MHLWGAWCTCGVLGALVHAYFSSLWGEYVFIRSGCALVAVDLVLYGAGLALSLC